VTGSGATARVGVLRASLATSIETTAGSWATIPMGHLDQPLNTFWQLFFRPPGATLWSDQASALAVATNGGLIVASRGSASLVVGIRPTNYLDYSPLIVTSDARSWSPEGPIGALADEPDALAIAGGGEAMALTSDGSSTRVILSRGRLASWRQIATEQGLARSQAGHLCGPVLLTAVGYASRARAHRGELSPRRHHRHLHLAPGHLASRRAAAAAVVAQLDCRSAGSAGGQWRPVCARRSHRRGLRRVVVACTSGSELKWDVSPVMSIVGRQHVVSFGSAGRLGLYVLTSGSADGHLLAVSGQTETSWRRLPSPPSRTAVVVFDPAGRVDALAADDTSFTDWRLVGGDNWKRVQQVRVPIQFGSSG